MAFMALRKPGGDLDILSTASLPPKASRGTMDFRTVRKHFIPGKVLPLGMTTTSHGKVNLVVSHFSRLFKSFARVKVCFSMFVKCCMIYLDTHTCI
jgi:hypothetical protein